MVSLAQELSQMALIQALLLILLAFEQVALFQARPLILLVFEQVFDWQYYQASFQGG